MPVYLVKTPDGKERVVDAANKAAARNHVVRNTVEVSLAEHADVARICKAGGDIETAGADAAEPEGGDDK